MLRGGPGTGKTVVGLHRAAWLVYNDQRLTADRILVLGPSERYLRFVATVLPSLGEARVVQTTFDRLLGPSCAAGSDERWIALLDELERSLLRPATVALRGITVPEDEVAALIDRFLGRALPWRERRKLFVTSIGEPLRRQVNRSCQSNRLDLARLHVALRVGEGPESPRAHRAGRRSLT